jgi:hypothetical protein
MVSVRQEMPTALRWERPILHGAAFARQSRKIATYQNTSLYGRSLRRAYDPRCLRPPVPFSANSVTPLNMEHVSSR